MKTKILSLIFVFLAHIYFAQERKATLQSVINEGFNQILIPPELRSASKNNLDFIRILDSKKNEVPYVLFQKQNETKTFQNFEILSKNVISNASTSVIISNKNSEKINHLNLKIANTQVSKKYNISGSNDEKEWFGLIDNQIIDQLFDEKSTFVNREFSFPINQYKYLKFTFIDKNSLPINVLEAGNENSYQNNSTPIDLGNFKQTISKNTQTKQSIIKIEFNDPQVIDEIKFSISSPKFYVRNAQISIPKTRIYKNKTENYVENTTFFQISSKTGNSFSIPEMFSKNLTITIDNQDNAALEIDKISVYQNPVYLLSDLKKGANYSIIVNPKLSKPQYDLAESRINFNENFPLLNVNQLEKIENNQLKEVEKSFWQTGFFMWICILVAIIAIGFFAINLLKDVNNEK